jgi:hypothetical protein
MADRIPRLTLATAVATAIWATTAQAMAPALPLSPPPSLPPFLPPSLPHLLLGVVSLLLVLAPVQDKDDVVNGDGGF